MITRFRRKPQPPPARDDVLAIRYEPGMSLIGAHDLARLADDHAEIGEVTFPSGRTVLLARFLRIPDDHPAYPEYVAVEPGDWLAYSGEFLYRSTDGNWRQWYEEVPG